MIINYAIVKFSVILGCPPSVILAKGVHVFMTVETASGIITDITDSTAHNLFCFQLSFFFSNTALHNISVCLFDGGTFTDICLQCFGC